MHPLLQLCAGVAAWETGWWLRRRHERARLYDQARQHAIAIGKPLVVVGAPDQGVTSGPGCGDICVDIAPTKCPCSIECDITKGVPLPSDSCVCFVSCVLEYVTDREAAWRELQRLAPGRVYVARVEPWTLAAYLYPGAKHVLASVSPAPRLGANSR